MSEERLIRIEEKLDGLVGIVGIVVEIRTDVGVLKSDVAELNMRVGLLAADVGVLTTDVAELKADVTVLKTDVAELKADVGVLRTDVSELKIGQIELGQQMRTFHHEAMSAIVMVIERVDGLDDRMAREFAEWKRESRQDLAVRDAALRRHSRTLKRAKLR